MCDLRVLHLQIVIHCNFACFTSKLWFIAWNVRNFCASYANRDSFEEIFQYACPLCGTKSLEWISGRLHAAYGVCVLFRFSSQSARCVTVVCVGPWQIARPLIWGCSIVYDEWTMCTSQSGESLTESIGLRLWKSMTVWLKYSVMWKLTLSRQIVKILTICVLRRRHWQQLKIYWTVSFSDVTKCWILQKNGIWTCRNQIISKKKKYKQENDDRENLFYIRERQLPFWISTWFALFIYRDFSDLWLHNEYIRVKCWWILFTGKLGGWQKSLFLFVRLEQRRKCRKFNSVNRSRLSVSTLYHVNLTVYLFFLCFQ